MNVLGTLGNRTRRAANAQEWADAAAARWALLAEELRHRLGAGTPLEPAARRFFERRLGHDLASVRLHRGFFAGRLAHRLGAAALSTGSHVLGEASDLDDQTAGGAALLGHELVHAIQQTAPLPLAGRSHDDRPVRGSQTGDTAAGLGPHVQRAARSRASGGGSEVVAQDVEQALLDETQTPAAAGAARQGRVRPVDAEAVADRVYRRLVDELRLARERADWLG